jgi:ectoine hydroxylase
MNKWVQKYTGILRSLRITYWLYNISNINKLSKNKQLYKKLGVNKAVWQSIAHADIKHASTDIPWMDKAGITVSSIESNASFKTFSLDIQEQLLNWPNKGYIMIPKLFEAEADLINAEIDRLKEDNKVDFNFTGRKIMDAWKHSDTLNSTFRNKQLLNIFEFIFQKKVIPFQTINFIYGSEQRPHSDSIHMTTEPLGYLSAAWIALEDIQPGSGELIFYPGSHKLNYVLSEDYATGNNALLIGERNYDNYEDKIDELIKQQAMVAQYFYPKKGDVFIWHANLLHGGSAITNPLLTRKSMVGHYYADGVLCYHEISQRPAVIK